jgi:D-sedoheptulose 7-phosphate isomerase
MSESIIKKQFEASAQNLDSLANSANLIQSVYKATQTIVDSLSQGGCLFLCGNGGSAGDSQNFATELVARLKNNRSPIKALCLNSDSSVMTAISNDFSYDQVFSRQLEALASSKDVLLTISTSGNSPSILNALTAAKKIKMKSILLGGYQGGKALAIADLSMIAPGENAGFIQECHIVIYHTICGIIETELAHKKLVQFY